MTQFLGSTALWVFVRVCMACVYVCVFLCVRLDRKWWSFGKLPAGLSASSWHLFSFVCCFLFVTKSPRFLQHTRSHVPASASTEAPADGKCALENVLGTFNTSEAFLLCCLAVVLPQFPQKEPHVREVLTDPWSTTESELLKTAKWEINENKINFLCF